MGKRDIVISPKEGWLMIWKTTYKETRWLYFNASLIPLRIII